jgi:chromosome segregation ATPase
MKCLKVSFMVLLLVLSLPVFAGTHSDETTSEKLDRLTTKVTEISKQFNEISSNSELTLMDLQVRFPKLVQEVDQLKTEVSELGVELKALTERSEGLLQKWTNLSNGISKLSSSVETFQMSLTNLGDSVKRAEKRSNTGLWISIGAFIAGVIALGFSIFGGK